MTSLEPAPPKRLKISPPLQQPRQRLQSPSKLPVRNGSAIVTVDRTKSASYHSPARQKFLQRSERKLNGTSANESMGGIGKLNFSARDGGGGGRFRRAGGRLSQSPARRGSFFNDQNAASSVPRMASLGEENESIPTGEGKSSPTAKIHKAWKPMKEKEVTGGGPLPKSPGEEVQEVVNSNNEALRKLVEARVNALKLEVEGLQAEVRREEARVERDAMNALKTGQTDVEAMVKRLLSANDTSHTTLPPLPTLPTLTPHDPEIPSAKPLTPSDPLPSLSAFHCLTFTSTTVTTVTTVTTPESLDNVTTIALSPSSNPATINLLQRHSTTGYASNRLLFFTLSFTVAAKDWTVQQITYELSSWARRELSRPLSLAAEEGNINTVLYALSSYTTLAKKRASVFARLCRAFPHLLTVFAPKQDAEGKPTRREIIPWLGNSVLKFKAKNSDVSFQEGGVELVMSWDIGLDENGEAESILAADVRLPVYYTEVDEMKSLKKVGEMFNMLVKEKGVFGGVKCVVGLVFQ